MSVQTGLWETDNRAVPLHVCRRFRVSSAQLRMWRELGWLGKKGSGSGRPYDWDSPEVVEQIDWLRRLNAAGRVLDDEDAAGGFRLRAGRVAAAVRVQRAAWMPLEALGDEWPADLYTLAVVRSRAGQR